MKKNPLALTVYRTVKAANDDGSSAAAAYTNSVTPHLQLAPRSGWDPFEVWRTRIRVLDVRQMPRPRGKR